MSAQVIINKITYAHEIEAYEVGAHLQDDAIVATIQRLAGASEETVLADMMRSAKLHVKRARYTGTTLGEPGQFGRPSFVHPEHKTAPASKTFNIFWKAVSDGGIMVPGSRSTRSDKGKAKPNATHKMSRVEQIFADALKLKTWEEFGELAKLINATCKKQGIDV